jgi:phosphoserine phosphatase
MTTIVLIRHGHVEGISPKRFRGQHPLPLSEQGLAEAQMTADRIVSTWRPAAVRTSPLERCVTTGRVIAEACGLAPAVNVSLQDLHYGEWEWKTYDEVKEQWPRLYERWCSTPHLVRFPFGESLQDIVLRSAEAFRTVVESFPDDIIVLVGHDSVNRALLLQLLDQPLSAYWRLAQDPCCINVIEYKNGKIAVKSINDTSHIRWSSATRSPPRVLRGRNADGLLPSAIAAERTSARNMRNIEASKRTSRWRRSCRS